MSTVDSPFQVPPFPSFPSFKRYVPIGSQEEAFQRVRRAIDAWEAISLVIGPPGTGKSLIVQMLAEYFGKKREVVVLGDTTIESPAALQRYLLRRLTRSKGIEPSSAAIDDLQLTLIDRIRSSSAEFPGLLLLVDEAQTLSPEVLETIRILTNVMVASRPLVSAVLLGGPRLDETLALPILESLVQRVATRCYLHPLNVDETVRYVNQIIEDCGSDPAETIENSAIRSIHRACGGVPRLINQVMTAAIDVAAVAGQSIINRGIVDRAWALLQQLPSPMVEEAKLAPVHSVEFGPLSDEPVSSKPVSKGTASKSPLSANANNPAPKPIPLENFIAQTQFSESLLSPDLSPVSIDCTACDCLPDASTARRTPSLEILFGSFDVEEPIQRTSIPASRSSLVPSKRPQVDLETSLHQEIVSLRGEATSRLRMLEVDGDDEPAEPRPNPRRVGAPLLWLPDDEANGQSMADDSDMLVIEDDVPIDGPEMVSTTDQRRDTGSPISVDFHSMLAKMRSPQNDVI